MVAIPSLRVDRVFARALVVRTVLVWIVLRAVAVAGQQMSPMGSPPGLRGALTLRPVALLFLYVMVVAAILLDAKARREDQFLANLGTSRLDLTALIVVTVTVLEILLVVLIVVVTP